MLVIYKRMCFFPHIINISNIFGFRYIFQKVQQVVGFFLLHHLKEDFKSFPKYILLL